MSRPWRTPEQYRADEEALWARLRPLLEAGGVLRSDGRAEGTSSLGPVAIGSGAVLRLFAAGRIKPVLSGWVLGATP